MTPKYTADCLDRQDRPGTLQCKSTNTTQTNNNNAIMQNSKLQLKTGNTMRRVTLFFCNNERNFCATVVIDTLMQPGDRG